jgi:hypothetical protein
MLCVTFSRNSAYPGVSVRLDIASTRGHWESDSFYGTIHAEDTLDHRSWEVSEKWFRENPLFWDKEVLEVTNSWRLRRRESILTREEFAVR